MWLIRSGDALRPDSPESAALFSKLPFGKLLQAEIKQPRSLQHHRLYWALVQRIANATGAAPENISDLLKIATGHCAIVKTRTMGEVKLPRSISFAAMDQTGFREFFDRCVLFICENWGIDHKDIMAAIDDLVVRP